MAARQRELWAGVVLMLGLIIGCIVWYSSRPKAWDQESLTANPKVLWTFTEDPQGKFENVSLMYIVQNTTNRDITISSPVTIMLNPESGDLTELPTNLYHVQFPSFIPAGRSVQVELDAPTWYNAGRGKGFILYDYVNHYQIDLPEPNGPTDADQKRMFQNDQLVIVNRNVKKWFYVGVGFGAGATRIP